jgi:hypothetical protein
MPDRDRLTKVLTLALHPHTVPQEAVAALHRARDLVKANLSLAHPAADPGESTRSAAQSEATFNAKITSVHPDWILILVGLLSSRAYDLNLKYKIDFDLSQALTAIDLNCEGSKQSCGKISRSMEWAANYRQ